MASFGDRYKGFIKSNPNKQSEFNTNPGSVYVTPNTNNKYSNLISLNPNKQSLFNSDPGSVYISPKSNNPYTKLIDQFQSTLITPTSGPFIGRSITPIIVDLYYVVNGYVDDGYVEVQNIML